VHDLLKRLFSSLGRAPKRGRDRDQPLFFSDVVASYVANPRFLRRPWLAQAINQLAEDPQTRFVLVIGEPGAGKSTFLAQLADEHPLSLVYFIRRDQISMLGGVSAHAFLTQVGFQFAHLYPDLFDADELRVTIEQYVSYAAGPVVGLDVDRLVASPFYRSVLLIKQRIGSSGAQISGLRVRELVADPLQIDLQDLQFMALISPAITLLRRRPRERIVLLIDALDELAEYDPTGTIVEWLTNCPELPPNIKILMTSRPPNAAVRALCARHATSLREFHMASSDERISADLRTYAQSLVQSAPIVTALDKAGIAQTAFVSKLLDLAEGNIGYLDAFARALDYAISKADEGQVEALLSLRSTPASLQSLHRFFVAQVEARARSARVEAQDDAGNVHFLDAWSALHSRLLSVLSVAREPLTREQLRRLGGVRTDSSLAYEDLTPLLECVNGACRFYHNSLGEALLCSDDVPGGMSVFCVNAREWHARIADAYLRKINGEWARFDDYGVRNVIAHTLDAGRIDELHSVMTRDWLSARSQREDFTFGGCLDDVARARALLTAATVASVPTRAWLHMVEWITRDSVAQHTDDELRVFAWLDHLSQALGLARTRPFPKGVAEGLLAIYHVTRNKESPRHELIDEALEWARRIDHAAEREHTLQRIVWAYAQASRFDAAEAALVFIDTVSYRRPYAIKLIASAYAKNGDLKRAEQTIDRIPEGESKAAALTALAKEHISLGAPISRSIVDRALKASRHLDAARDEALSDLAAVFSSAGWWDDTISTLRGIRDPGKLASAVCYVLKSSPSRATELYDLLRQAYSNAAHKDGSHEKDALRESFIRAFVAAGRLEEALAITEETGLEEQARLRVNAYLAAGDIVSAREQVGAAAEGSARLRLLCDIADATIDHAEHRDRALQEAGAAIELAETFDREYAAERLAKTLVAVGRLDDAWRVGSFIATTEKRCRVFAEIAEAFAKEDRTTALRVLADIRRARDESGQTSESAADALTNVVHALACIDIERARAIIPHALHAWSDRHDPARAVRDLVTPLLQMGQHELAGEVLQHAEGWSVPDDVRDDYLRRLVRAGLTHQALERADAHFGYSRDHSLHAIGSELAAQHRFDEAERAASAIKERWIRAEAFRSIALNALQSDPAYAEHVARTLVDDFGKTLVDVFVATGRLEEALKQAQSIHFDLARIEALCAVGVPLMRKEPERGLDLLANAESIACALDNQLLQGSYRRQVVDALLAAGRIEEAVQVIRREPEAVERDRAYVEVARTLAMAHAIEPAMKITAAVESDVYRNSAIEAVTKSLIAAGDLEAAWNLVTTLEDHLVRDEMLVLVARALVSKGRLKDAGEILARLRSSLSKEALRAFRDLAQAHAADGRLDLALTAVPVKNAEELMGCIADCAPIFERAEAGTTLRILEKSIGVLCWKYARWNAVHDALFAPGPT
jgi:hypothetical protein